MGRKPRVEFKGAIYHVIKRGNNREYIFREKEDNISVSLSDGRFAIFFNLHNVL